MLRYKNSLLERILLEKGRFPNVLTSLNQRSTTTGIDVQAELKSISEPGPSRLPSNIPQQTPVPRAIMNQQQNSRRSVSRPSPRLLQAQKLNASTASTKSPQLQPTPPSQTSSPTASRSPNFAIQGGIIPPHPGLQPQSQPQPKPQQQPQPSSLRTNTFQPLRSYPGITLATSSVDMQPTAFSPMSNPQGAGRSSVGGPRSNPWPSPYRTHMEQLGKLTRPFLSLLLNRALFVLD